MASSSPETRVLLVEDEPELREMYAEWLRADYRVFTAEDAPSALETLDESIDVVLLDRNLPGTWGEELIPHVRKLDEDCRIAMVTGVEPAWDVLEMDFDAHLAKPVREEDLRVLVEALCEHDDDLLAGRTGVTL